MFHIKGVYPGKYTLSVQVQGFVSADENPRQVEVKPQAVVTGVNLQLERGAIVHGRVLNTEGAPLAETTITTAAAQLHQVRASLNFSRGTVTDSMGSFSVTVPSHPEKYRYFALMVRHPAHQGQIVREHLVRNQSEYHLEDIILKKTLEIFGTISDPYSASVKGLEVELVRHSEPLSFRGYVPFSQKAYTDKNGRFVFGGLYPTQYSLVVRRDGILCYFRPTLEVATSESLEARLEKTKKIRGRIANVKGESLRGAHVVARYQGTNPSIKNFVIAQGFTDLDGNFALEVLKISPPSTYTLQIMMEGYLSGTILRLKNFHQPLNIVLQKGGLIKGYIFVPKDIPQDKPLSLKVLRAGMKMAPIIDVLPGMPKPISETLPVGERSFEIGPLPREEYGLYVTGDGFAAVSTTVDLTSGDAETALVAQRSTTLRGRLFWADTKAPITGAVIQRSYYPWELEPGEFSSLLAKRLTVKTDCEGTFEFDNLSPGLYFLKISYVVASLEEVETQFQQRILKKQIQVMIDANTQQRHRFYLGRGDAPFKIEPD
jgi:hypothetical protein